MQKLQVYVLQINGQIKLALMRNPFSLRNWPEENFSQVRILTPPLPSFQAYASLGLWVRRLEGFLAPWWRGILFVRSKKPTGDLNWLDSQEQRPVGEILEAIAELVTGRLLTEEVLVTALQQKGFWPAELNQALDLGVRQGLILQFPGIKQDSWGRLICTRCNSETVLTQPCSICGSLCCPICRECFSLGPVRGCTTFIAAPIKAGKRSTVAIFLRLRHTLTRAQQGAAEELLWFWQGPKSEALVWAACGAGKTEVTFPLIAKALSQGCEVLFAIPRLDIVKEMKKRLQEAFPKVDVAVHHGGQPILSNGNLVIATTHQVLRFYRRFALAILDEVDAFPYQGNEALRFGLKRALTAGGKLVQMTATPSSFRRSQQLITIPARFHGRPLPVPQIQICPLPAWEELISQRLPAEVINVLEKGNHPWLVFVPTIAACGAIAKVLRLELSKKIGICHSQDPKRQHTIRDLRLGLLDLVVSTSVLERGVNFPGIGVIVLYAHHPIFTKSALVQMAGRVGRTADEPQGTILFVGRSTTAAMRNAVQLIRRLNSEAAKKGLLNHDSLS